MTSAEFRNLYLKLSRGFGKEAEVTNERLQALYDSIGYHDSSVLDDAVSRCLCDSRMPSHGQLLAALERAEDVARRRTNARHDSEAKGAMRGLLPALGRTGEFDGLMVMRTLVTAGIESGATPEQVAASLEPHTGKHPELAAEVAHLRTLAAWPDYPDAYSKFIAVYGRWDRQVEHA